MVRFPENPEGPLRLRNAQVPAALLAGEGTSFPANADGLARVDLEIADGLLTRVDPAGTVPGAGGMDLDGSQVWPAFTDVHTHLDKGHILPRIFNPDGSHPGAAQAVMRDRSANWSAGDVRRRFEFGLACAFAHGTAAIRTHLDSQPPQATISFPVFSEMREAWAGRIELQAVGMLPLDDYLTPAGEEFAALVARHGGLLGGPSAIRGQPLEASRPLVRKALDALFRLADRHGLDIDLHVDESGDPAAQTLGLVARAAIEHRFQGRVTCGHCCSLAVQPADVVRETLDLCAEAGLAVVSLPMVNLYLQDRHAPATPRWRGVTLVHELKARGVPVAVASDNCRDPFYAFGDHDVFEVFNQSVRICHLDVPYGDWPRAVTATPAAIMKRTHGDALRVGAPADLIIFRGRSMNELLARPQADRIVLRAGHAIDTTLPDHRILDDLFAPPASR